MGLNRLDLIIIAIYLSGITLFGLRFRKRQRSLRDYFLADRDIPWWAIALSIVAAETSTLTIISIPGLAYDTNLTFMQVVMGYVLGRVIISFVLLPHYFRGDLYTAYELIERRFGRGLRSLTAGLFLITRAAAEGVRVYAVSIVVTIALGTGEIASIAIITALTLIYTFEGGLAAVIWTDVVQTVIYIGGTLVGLFTILHLVPGGWPAIHSLAETAGNIYPTFIVSKMPHGISGLLIAAILAAAMSNLSAALNSLSSSSMIDFYLRGNPQINERRRLQLSRLSTFFWALVLFGLAVLSLHKVGRVVEVGLQIASVAYGALLGVFLLGVLTKRANQNGAMLGMLCGFVTELYIWLGTRVPWTWYVAIGTLVTFGVGYMGGLLFERNASKP